MLKVHVDHQWMRSQFDVYFYIDEGDRRRFAQPGDPWIWVEHTGNIIASDCIKPIVSIPDHAAGLLIAELAKVGVRPPEQSRVEGMLEKQGEHLKDLQNILRCQKLMT